MNIRKELLINEVNESKSKFFLDVLIRDYGYESLVELDDIFGYNIIANKMAEDNELSYTMCDKISHLAELRTLFKVIVDKFTYGEENYKIGICNFIKIIRKSSYDTRKRWEEKLNFVATLIKEEINKSKENSEYVSFIDELIESININPFMQLEELKDLFILLGTEYKEVVIKLLEIKVSRIFDSQIGLVTVNMQNIIIILKDLYLLMDELNTDYEFNINIERVVRDGLREAMNETWFIVNVYPVFLSVNDVVDLYLDLDNKYYKIFFEVLYTEILLDEYDLAEEVTNVYKEENGELPYESILREIEDNSLTGLIYTIHFSIDIKNYPIYYFYWEIHKKMDAMEDVVRRLIEHNILPEDIVTNPKRMMENIKYDNLVINDIETEFEIDNFLDGLDLDE